MAELTDEQKAAKARSMFTSKKSSSFLANTGMSDEDRKKAIEAYKKSNFSKSLSAEELTAIDPETGLEGKWVRPKITFDKSSDHVPPPPSGPVPTFNLPPGGGKVPLPVQHGDAAKAVMAKASSGVFKVGSKGADVSKLSKPIPEDKLLTDEQKAAKARSMFTSKKSSSFIANTGLSEEERKAALEAYKNSKFSKSLTAEELTAIDPLTGEQGKWVRPKIKFDQSAEHIPPPPLEPVPEAVKKADSSLGGGKVPMPVIGEDGKAKVVMAKATSGVFRRGGSVTRPGSVTGGPQPPAPRSGSVTIPSINVEVIS